MELGMAGPNRAAEERRMGPAGPRGGVRGARHLSGRLKNAVRGFEPRRRPDSADIVIH
jgi:hypothetical protein